MTIARDETRTASLIQTSESYRNGLIASAVTGAAVFVIVYWVLNYVFDFRYVGDVLGIVLGFVAAVLAGFLVFVGPGRKLEIELKRQGVPTFRDDPVEGGRTYDTGTHWVGPLWGMTQVPGPDEIITMDLPGEDINTQDGSVVLMGRHENVSASKPNRASFRVANPFRFVRVRDFKQQFKSLYNGLARVYFGQMANAYAVKNERTLFEEFLELPAGCYRNPTHPEYGPFRDRLLNAKYQAVDETWKEIFARDINNPSASTAVTILMSRAGEFLWMCERWGVEAEFYPTNVRVDPRLEQAATDRTATASRMAAAKEQSNTIAAIVEEFTSRGVTANMAALIATDRVDPTSEVKLEHLTRDFPQFTPEAIAAAVAQIIAAIREERR